MKSPGAVDTEVPAARLAVAFSPLLVALYPWLATVLFPTLSLRGGPAAQCTAWLAGASLLTGVVPRVLRRAWALHWSLVSFMTWSLITWLLLSDKLHAVQLDPIQAALGGFGWLLFALSVPTGPVPLHRERLQPLPSPLGARSSKVTGSDLLFLMLIAASAAPVLLSWRISHESRAVLAHLGACSAALLAVRIAGGTADPARRTAAKPGSRIARVWATLALLSVLLVVGLTLKVF